MINGVLGALLERTRTGRGRRIEVSLFATALSSLGTVIASASAGGPAPRPWGSGHPSIVPYRAFAAADGHAVLGATNDPMFVRLAAALDMEDELGREQWVRNEGRVRDRETLEALLADRLAQFTVDEIAERLHRHRVLIARVRRADDAARDAQAAAMGMMFEEDGVLLARSALGTNGTAVLGSAPLLGEHNEELLG